MEQANVRKYRDTQGLVNLMVYKWVQENTHNTCWKVQLISYFWEFRGYKKTKFNTINREND